MWVVHIFSCFEINPVRAQAAAPLYFKRGELICRGARSDTKCQRSRAATYDVQAVKMFCLFCTISVWPRTIWRVRLSTPRRLPWTAAAVVAALAFPLPVAKFKFIVQTFEYLVYLCSVFASVDAAAASVPHCFWRKHLENIQIILKVFPLDPDPVENNVFVQCRLWALYSAMKLIWRCYSVQMNEIKELTSKHPP